MARRNPLASWGDYERGMSPGRGSISSWGGRSGQDDESMPGDIEGLTDVSGQPMQRRNRRTSLSRQLGAVVDIGGVNSLRSFSRSWARAAGFAEVIPHRPSFVYAQDQAPLAPEHGIQYGRVTGPDGGAQEPRHSLLGQGLQHSAGTSPGTGPSSQAAAEGSPTPVPRETDALLNPLEVVASHGSVPSDFRDRERKALESELGATYSYSGSPGQRSFFAIPPHLATPPIGSYTSFRSYGTVQSGTDRASMIAAGPLWRQQEEAEGEGYRDEEQQPILIREVEQDGKIVLAVEGQSTLPQTVFNMTNTLIGIGLLSLPLAIKYSGWLIGMIALFLAAAVTAYTAKLLTKCMDLDVSLITFSDIAFISFGSRARLATSVLFTMELLAACVALVVLFADSLNLLFPDLLAVTQWKYLCGTLLVPLNFMPLKYLSYTSVLGIIACSGIVIIIIVDGFLKSASPGSLLEPATTYLWPANWMTLPLSFGMLMSPWGAHSVFPNIYRDMRHPQKYSRAVKYTYFFTYALDAVMAVVGILMFGDDVRDEVTSSILLTSGYPRVLTFLMCALIAIIPLTKIPLNARPIVSTLEVLTGLHSVISLDENPSTAFWKGIARIAIRVGSIIVFVAMAILFPAFDTIMAFMGSALCFTICVILPVTFYLKLFGKEITIRERLGCYALLAVSSTLCIVGTVWTFLPKHVLGLD